MKGSREVGGFDSVSRGGEDKTLDDIAELADITRPRKCLHTLDGGGVEFPAPTAVFCREVAAKHIDQRGNILWAVSQRWQADSDHVEAVE